MGIEDLQEEYAVGFLNKGLFMPYACFSYILKFTHVVTDKINHTGEVVINIYGIRWNNTFI